MNPTVVANQDSSGGLFGGLGSIAGALIGCVSPETLVQTPDGMLEIQDIEVGDMVLGENGFTEVEMITIDQKDIFDIVTKENILVCTSTQPIKHDDGSYKTLNQLSCGDRISGKEILGIYYAGESDVYELKVKDINFYAGPFLIQGYTEEEAEKLYEMVGDFNG